MIAVIQEFRRPGQWNCITIPAQNWEGWEYNEDFQGNRKEEKTWSSSAKFVQRSGCGTWEEALDTYEDVSENLEMFQGILMDKDVCLLIYM